MSSHHIVREKQEPALLIFSLDDFTDEHLGQLLEWSPTVVAATTAAEQLATLDIKVDYVLGDNPIAVTQGHVKTIPLTNQYALAAALEFLVKEGYPAVNIITNNLDLSLYHAYASRINLVIFCQGLKIYPVSSGFSKWKPVGNVITLLTPSAQIQTKGLTALNEQQYQTTADGFITLQFAEDFLFVGEGY